MADETLDIKLDIDENIDVSFYTDETMTANMGEVMKVDTEHIRANYNQTDPDAKDYIIGRENIVGRAELDTVTEEILAKAKASGEFDGADGADGYTPVKGVDYFDGEDGYTPVKGVDYFDGKDGQSGKDGSDGTPCTHRWSGTTLYVTSASGTTFADLKGDKGDAGPSGKDGYTPVKGVDYRDGIDGRDGTNGKDGKDGKDGANGQDGKDGADGYTPKKGTDYFTAADKAEMVSAVIAALPVYNGEVVTA